MNLHPFDPLTTGEVPATAWTAEREHHHRTPRTPGQERRLMFQRRRAIVAAGALVAVAAVAYGIDAIAHGTSDPSCTFSTDTDVTATSVYFVQHNDGKDTILYQIPGVNANQCKASAETEVDRLNQGRGVDLDAPRYDQTVIVPASAEFHRG